MKHCPECNKNYADPSISFCLNDGTPLIFDQAIEEPSTAIMPTNEAPTRQLPASHEPTATSNNVVYSPNRIDRPSYRRLALVIFAGVIVLSAAAIYISVSGGNKPDVPAGSFRSVDSPAYEYYLRGKIDSSSQNQERNESAIRILETVVAADPGFAPAYANLARAYGIKADLFAPENEKAKLYDEGRLAAEKSLALDPQLAEGHLVRGTIIWNSANRFPHEQTILSLKRAIAIDPNLPEAHHQLGRVFYHIGLLDRSLEEMQRAIDLDPTNASARYRIGSVHAYRTEYEKALAVFKTVPPDANPTAIERALAGVLFQLGRYRESAEIVDRFLAKYADEGGNVTSVRAMLLAKEGRNREAKETIQQAITRGQGFQHFHHTTYNIASAYLFMGDRDEAMRWLQFTVDEGFPCYPYFLKDANLDSLRNDRRFIAMMETMRQQWERFSATL